MGDEDTFPNSPGEPDETIASDSSPTAAPDLPAEIGGYRILRKLGEGGMGIVYEAEQRDPRRRVAVKVIRGGAFVDEQTVRLFQREVQTLGRLKHAGIASIYEAGRTEDGQHFFAMELVHGLPLHEYLRARTETHGLSRGEILHRLALFRKICDAVNYAHQRGVIHRDLKPSNIIVAVGEGEIGSEDPEIKILDFGLARIVDADAPGATVVTGQGQIQGTLPYMSPEQARGVPDEIDLRTDVYALGIILYRFLTGVHPYDVGRASIPEAIRVICQESPARPSGVVRWVRGDLETIVLKALEKEPDRRYQSAYALAEEIERHLANQPILARPPSAAYQLRKLIARHKGAFAFIVSLVVVLAAFAVTMSWMFGIQRQERMRADAERDRAVVEGQKAERINRFLQEMLASIDPEQARGREVMVRDVLDEAGRRLETSLSDQPEIQAAVRTTIGNTYRALGRFDEAEPHLREALAIRRERLGEENAEVAGSLSDLAALLWEKGEYEAAEPLFREALKVNRSATEGTSPEVATSLNNLALLLKSRGRYDAAEPLLRDALRMRRALFGDRHPEVASSLNNLSGLLEVQGRHADAEPPARDALAIRRELLGEDHPDVAQSLNNLATILQAQGKYDEAEPVMREALERARAVYGSVHPATTASLNNLALLLDQRGDPASAEPLYREALRVYRQVLGEEHPSIASSMNNLAGVLRRQERYAAAESLYRASLAMRRGVLGEEHPAVATGMNNLAMVLQDRGRDEEAEALYRRALDVRERLLGPEHPRLASSLLGLASLLLDRGDPGGAEALLVRCRSIYERNPPRDPWIGAYAENLLGCALAARGAGAEAESLLEGGLRVLEGSVTVPRRIRDEAVRRTALARAGRAR
ncbi:MAG: tetratricopeptide repeat protein [Candidatus Eisenbacteria bacterium]|nr:tetratricopeptide repeat protein [Candidatus Latescibacterota bacterium]MBD3301391.1 tetratricopeptide repeat protein [Candidatus Eisenbacteria bacterium]